MKLSSEQIELQDIIRRFLAESVTSEYLRKRFSTNQRCDPKLWLQLEELGLEEGFGADPAPFSIEELGLIAHECGYALVPEPVVGRLLASFVAPRMASIVTNAKPTAVIPPACCDLLVDPSTGRLRGNITGAAGCDGAEQILAFASTSQGTRCVLIPVESAGLVIKPSSSLDLTTGLSEVCADSVEVQTCSAEATRVIEDLIEALAACEAAGVCERVIEMTSAHVKTRTQFGRAIGSFQAVQQQLAQVYAQVESLTSLSRFVLWAAVHSPEQRTLTARAAVTQAADIAPRVCEVAIQCHGGIGFTWEYDLHLYLRRALSIQAMFRLTEARAGELIESASAAVR